MTIAEKLINEGFLNAKSETAISLLSKKFGAVPKDLHNTIQHADAETLNRMLGDRCEERFAPASTHILFYASTHQGPG